MEKKLRFETIQLHGGQSVDATTKSRAVPIYQTTSYVFDNCDQAENLFALKEAGNIYSRITNPTVAVFEERMAQLEGGVGAVATASGSAAITYAIMNVARVGDEIVAASTLYGGTYNLLDKTLPNYGIKTIFVDPSCVENFKKAITSQTKAIYIEAIGNPSANLIDMQRIAEIAHEAKIPLIVDSTFATPYLLRPIEHGANIVVHSATKFIGGHGTTIGGVVIDGGNFDWEASGKFASFTLPDASYHGIVYTKDCGAQAYSMKLRVQLLRDTGACLSPFNAFLLLQGLETLSLRVERHVENTRKIVEYLQTKEEVSWINYPELKESPYYELSKAYFEKGVGAIFTFGLKGGEQVARKWINGLKIFSQLANVADAKSLVIHPASTTHGQLSEQEQQAAGVTKEMIRLSVGIENSDDLIEDMEAAFAKLHLTDNV